MTVGGDQGENCAGEQPKVYDVKQGLILADDHVAGKNHSPAAHGDGKMIHRIGLQARHADQTPKIGHFRDNQGKCQQITQIFFPF